LNLRLSPGFPIPAVCEAAEPCGICTLEKNAAGYAIVYREFYDRLR
jgi:hypothetical protein